MSLDIRLYRPIGVLSLLASITIIEAGVPAAMSFMPAGISLKLIVGSTAALSGFALLTAGALLYARRPFGWQLAYWGSTAALVLHILGVFIGLMGRHALLAGAGYPAAILLLLRAMPSGQQQPLLHVAG
jgi:hypothetical protein